MCEFWMMDLFSIHPLANAKELDAGAEAAKAACFQARGRACFDDAAVVGAVFVDGAWILTRHRDIEARTTLAAVIHETEERRPVIELGVKLESARAHALLVQFEEVDGARAVVTAPAARDTIASVRIGHLQNGFDRHPQSSCRAPN